MPIKTLQQRIKDKTWRRRPDQCWPWLGYIDKDGYGRVWIDKQSGSMLAHSALYRELHGPLAEGSVVLSCPILPECMNPKHFGLGTVRDYQERAWITRGKRKKKPPRTRKLTDEDVKNIYLSTARTTDLARTYNVSLPLITNIRSGRKYRRITEVLYDHLSQ